VSDHSHQSKPFDALNSRGLAGKREYVKGLARRDDAEALSLLVECLCDESWFLRELAEDALLRAGPRSSVVLLPLLEQGLWFTRTSAARVLGKFACRDAVPGLLRLAEDANETVAAAACGALIAIGRGGGTVRIAREVFRLPPDVRRRRIEELAALERPLADRIERLQRNERLMSLEGGDDLSDESPEVGGSEVLEREPLTGSAADARPQEPEPRRGDAPPP